MRSESRDRFFSFHVPNNDFFVIGASDKSLVVHKIDNAYHSSSMLGKSENGLSGGEIPDNN